jgi:hypothetical protein
MPCRPWFIASSSRVSSLSLRKSLRRSWASVAQTADAERRLVHQMQGHARPERLALHWLQAQSKSQVPRRRCSGAKSQIPTWLPDFVGQQLANFSLEAGQIARLKALLTLGALCLDLLGYRSRATGVEFFFANRSR